MFQIWFLPVLIVLTTVALSVPVGRYLAWVIDGRYRAPGWLRWLEGRLDTGPQTWKQYLFALLLFNVAAFLVGFTILALQPYHPQLLNPDGKGMLSPSTIFNTMCSFLSNTNLHHYPAQAH